MDEQATATAIQDYAVIGDGRTVALVGRNGSIDWLCWPRFDSPFIFGALLDAEAGCWRVAPIAPARVTRRYVDDTNVLETRFETATDLVKRKAQPLRPPYERQFCQSPVGVDAIPAR